MIGLIYQHKGDMASLFNALDNLKDNMKSEEFILSLWLDDAWTEDQEMELQEKLLTMPMRFVFGTDHKNIGITRARNKSVRQLLDFSKNSYKPFKLEQIVYCFTNCKWMKPLTDQVAAKFYHNKGLSAYKIACKDWLFERDFSLDSLGTIPYYTFMANQDRPDYLMVANVKTLCLDEEYEGSKYTPEDMAWYKTCGPTHMITMIQDELYENWFNEGGLTKTQYANPGEFEKQNIKAFYAKAEFFIDLFLKDKFPLTNRLLKYFTSSLVSCAEVIPLKKYEDTFIFPLLMQRIKDWGCNQKFKNGFKMTIRE